MNIPTSVVSYGVCNVGSILNMLRKIGSAATPVSTPAAVRGAGRIILPGIGSFDNGVRALVGLDLLDALVERAQAGVPFLGICLGMQLLGQASEEGVTSGLGLLRARSVRFRFNENSSFKVPHMGWNQVAPRRDNALLEGLRTDSRFYFVHSYHLVCDDPSDVLTTTSYGSDFTSMVHRDNVWGAQFHPEKSHRYGMELLRNFSRL